MLLAVDIGNTTVTWGLFERQTLKGHWRVATDPSKTSDEYGIAFVNLLSTADLSPDQVTGAIISSVVPSQTGSFERMVERYFHRVPLIVSAELNTGLTLRYKHPHEIGSDRLVNAAAAYAQYQTALIIVDFGTATTFCTITRSGEYLGGAIAPGLVISADALTARTAKLPKIELVRPKTAIGHDTVSSMQSGLIFGYAGLVDSMVERIQRELGQSATVIATGGLASVIATESRTIQEVKPFLTLEGLELLYRRSQSSHL